VNSFYVEGMDVEYIKEFEDSKKYIQEIRSRAGSADETLDELFYLYVSAFEDSNTMLMHYIQLQVQEIAPETSQEIDDPLKFLEDRYDSLQEAVVNTTALAKDIVDKLIREKKEAFRIKGDDIYVWGGATKAYAEGKISISVTNDKVTEEEAWNGIETFSSIKKTTQKDINDFKSFLDDVVFEKRENVALQKIQEDIASGKTQAVYTIVYGTGHNFNNNVESEFNTMNASVIKLTPKNVNIKVGPGRGIQTVFGDSRENK